MGVVTLRKWQKPIKKELKMQIRGDVSVFAREWLNHRFGDAKFMYPSGGDGHPRLYDHASARIDHKYHYFSEIPPQQLITIRWSYISSFII